MPMFILWLILCYLCGAIPWSVWLGKRFFHVDPRQQPDQNPGAANAFRAGGWLLGTSVLVLDFAKAFVPVAVARWLITFPSGQLFWLAIMPTVGHAFSVFLRFRGGRGIVSLFGVWAGLTLYQVPLIMGLTAISATVLVKRDEYRSLAIPIVAIVYLVLASFPPWMVLLAVAQLVLLAVKISPFVIQQHSRNRIGAV